MIEKTSCNECATVSNGEHDSCPKCKSDNVGYMDECEHRDLTVFFDIGHAATKTDDGELIIEGEESRDMGGIFCEDCTKEFTPSDFKSIKDKQNDGDAIAVL